MCAYYTEPFYFTSDPILFIYLLDIHIEIYYIINHKMLRIKLQTKRNAFSFCLHSLNGALEQAVSHTNFCSFIDIHSQCALALIYTEKQSIDFFNDALRFVNLCKELRARRRCSTTKHNKQKMASTSPLSLLACVHMCRYCCCMFCTNYSNALLRYRFVDIDASRIMV